MVMKQHALAFVAAFSILGLCSGVPCTAVLAQGPAGPEMRVLAVETFLADIAQNVAGGRFKVPALLPIGADPHGFQPTPADVAKVANCNVLIVHGAGIEEFLDEVLHNANVFITPGGIFGDAGDRFVRISLCAPSERMEEAGERIRSEI